MKCPKCETELRIASTFGDSDESGALLVQNLVCPNPKCELGRAGTVVDRLVHRIAGADGEGCTVCCGRLLVSASAGAFYVRDGIQSSRNGDELSAVCPECGKIHTLDVAGKSQII